MVASVNDLLLDWLIWNNDDDMFFFRHDYGKFIQQEF